MLENNQPPQKRHNIEKNADKCTYPPPADGVCVVFLCKSRCSATAPADQAGRASLPPTGNFTNCKIWKKNAARLHNDVIRRSPAGYDAPPDFTGPKNENPAKGQVFIIETVRSGRPVSIRAVTVITGCRSQPPRLTARWGPRAEVSQVRSS